MNDISHLKFSEILKMNKIFVYHGSDVIVENPKILHPSRALDFGMGFYTTLNKKQAKEFSKKVAERNLSENTFVNVYSLDISALKELSVLSFDKANGKWLDFVSANRNGTYSGEIFDVIFGAVANDTIFKTFIAYQNGILNKKQTIERLKIRKLYNQLTFCSEKSLSCLSFSGVL